MLVWPNPDATYTLSIKYRVLAQKLTETKPFPIGGMMLGETILAACRAVSEERMTNARGPLWEAYLVRLQGSIDADRRHSTAYDAGFANDPTSMRGRGRGRFDTGGLLIDGAVTHSGGYYSA
jgi:hypothetical protein